MTSYKLNSYKIYYDLIREAVLNEWDPIGVKDIAEARDEYDSYIPMLCKLIMTKSSKEDIFKYLWNLETQHMGLDGDRQATDKFADKLLQLSSDIIKDD